MPKDNIISDIEIKTHNIEIEKGLIKSMKTYFKNLLPICCRRIFKCMWYSFQLMPEYVYWFWRDLWYSSLIRDKKSQLAELLVTSHVLEKGITMPQRRAGFGYERVRTVIRRCKEAINSYTENHIEIQSALKDLEQYLQIHEMDKFTLPEDISDGIKSLLKYKKSDTVSCFESTPDDFFKETKNFYEFAHLRHTCRWFSGMPVDKAILIKVIKLAQTAPSACNRQSSKVYVIDSEDKKSQVLKLQTGNRGCGYRADKILLITADMRFWNFKTRTSAYLDAGIFTMNLLYALHYYKICACTLNAHLTSTQKNQLHRIVGYSDSEMPIVFIAIGKACDHFMIAGSQRLNTEQIYSFV